MTNPVYIIACTNIFGDAIYSQFERNPERQRILSIFGTENPLDAAKFITERNAQYAIDQTPGLKNARVVKLTATVSEVA